MKLGESLTLAGKFFSDHPMLPEPTQQNINISLEPAEFVEVMQYLNDNNIPHTIPTGRSKYVALRVVFGLISFEFYTTNQKNLEKKIEAPQPVATEEPIPSL